MAKMFFALTAVSLLCGGAWADQIILTNGDQITGKVITSEPQGLQISSALLGVIHVKWKVIKTIMTDQPLFVTLKDGRVISGRVVLSPAGPDFHIADGKVMTAPLNQIQALRCADEQATFERLQRPRLTELWAGSVDAGLSAAQGNTDILTASVNATASRTTHRDRTSFYFTSLFNRDKSESEPSSAANAVRSGARYDISLRSKLFSFGFTDFDSDQLQDLDLRNVIGAGLGWRIKKSTRTMLDIFSGGSFNHEYFSGQAARRTAETLFGEEMTHELSSRAVVKERFVMFPNLSEPGEYRMGFDASATTALNHWLKWQISVSNRFQTNPAVNTRKNDVFVTTGLGISFGEESPFHAAFRFVDLLVPAHD